MAKSKIHRGNPVSGIKVEIWQCYGQGIYDHPKQPNNDKFDARIDAIWAEQAELHPNGWLFGEWSIADAMYAPVALRFQTYGIELSEGAKAYQQKVLSSESLQQWLEEANQETDIVEEDEAGVEV